MWNLAVKKAMLEASADNTLSAPLADFAEENGCDFWEAGEDEQNYWLERNAWFPLQELGGEDLWRDIDQTASCIFYALVEQGVFPKKASWDDFDV